MITSLLGTKQGMTHVFLKNGVRQVASQIKITPNVVLGKRDVAKDGYSAVILGAGEKKQASKPMQGKLTQAKVSSSPRWTREVRSDEAMEMGQSVSIADT